MLCEKMASHTRNINNDSDDENDTLAELNEFLDRDHTGQRLADFLMRKRGLPRIKESVFGGCPLPNFKFTGNLKRSITPPPKSDTVVSTVTVQNKSPLNELSLIKKSNAENIELNKASSSQVVSPSKSLASNVLPRPETIVSPTHNSIPAQAVHDEAHRSGSKSPVYNSPRRRSGCYSDKLRRSAIKRRSLFAHRRQLLTEFEDSPEDFDPKISSTPVVFTQPNTPTRVSQPLRVDPGSSAESECVLENLNRCDQQLRKMIDEAVERSIQHAHDQSIHANSRPPSQIRKIIDEAVERSIQHAHEQSILANSRPPSQIRKIIDEAVERSIQHAHEQSIPSYSRTPSPQTSRPSSPVSQRLRTFTVEKGTMPGQVVLTPTNNDAEQEVSTKPLPTKLRSPVVRLRNISKVADQTSMRETPPRTPLDRSIVLNTPTQTSAPPSPQVQSEEIIPETQEAPQSPHEQLTNLFNKKDSPMVVIPVYQTFNGPPTSPTPGAYSFAQKKSTHQINTTGADKSAANLEKQAELLDAASQVENGMQTRNNKISVEPQPHVNKSIQTSAFVSNAHIDLITDDESMDDEVINNNSTAPLNLATGVTKSARLTRPRVKLNRQQLQEEPKLANVNNGCNSSAALNLHSRAQHNGAKKANNKPLNKAPNTPINGEKFACELSRMTNYEILDLRKRNSLGKIFPICGRKSIVDEEERVNLEKHIELELKRRNLSTQNIEEQQQLEREAKHEKTAMLPAPVGFGDVPSSQEYGNDNANDTLRTQVRRSRRWRRKANSLPMSTTLQNFLDATRHLQERKKSLRANNKRCLYTKGNSDSEGTPSPEKIRKLRSNIEIVPSPPATFKSNNIRLSQLPIVPPPPPVDLSPPSPPLSPFDDLIPPPPTHSDESLPPPPRQFSLDSDEELQVPGKSTPKKRTTMSAVTESQVEVSMRSLANDPTEAAEANTANRSIAPSPMRKSILRRRPSLRVQWEVDKEKSNIIEEQSQVDAEIMEPLRVSTTSPLLTAGLAHNKSSAEKRSKTNVETVEPQVESPVNRTQSNAATKSVYEDVASRVEKALPPVETVVAHSTTDTPTPPVSDDDQPSTSRAALNRSKALLTAAVAKDDALFKKPMNPAPKRTRKKKRSSVETEIEAQDNDHTLRRSKRGQVPLKNTWSFQSKDPTPLFQVLYRKQMDLCLARSNKRIEALKNKTRLSSMSSNLSAQYNNLQPVCTSTPLNPPDPQKQDKRKRSNRNTAPTKADHDDRRSGLGDANTRTLGIEQFSTIRESDTEIEDVQMQRQPLSVINEEPACETQASSKPTKAAKSEVRKARSKKKKNDQGDENKKIQSTPAEQLNTIFDQLKAASFCEHNARPTSTQAQDVNSVERPKETEVETVKSGQSESSRNELIAWLKGFSGNRENDVDNDVFCGMHFSTRGDLIFMDLDGIDYAFYDTKEKGSLGYMRFKPHQVRPAKRAKSYNLHFIVLTGEFMIGTSTEQKRNERRKFTTGDMIAINIGSRYSLENLSNDISILMVIKK